MTAPLKLLDQVRNVIRRKHYSYETEKSYLNWIKRFIAFHNMTPPRRRLSDRPLPYLFLIAALDAFALNKPLKTLSKRSSQDDKLANALKN